MENLERAWGEAARWSARLTADDCTTEERAAFDRWRLQQPLNQEAFERMQYVAALMNAAVTHDPRMQQLADRAMEESTAQQPGNRFAQLRRFSTTALAASVVLTVFLTIFFVSQRPTEIEASSADEVMVFEAQEQVPQQVSLPDGSVVSIDAGGRISVTMTASERRIELLAGRAFFDVAPDKARPFAVIADDTRTVALGTRFEVSRLDRRTVVTLEEGSIVIDGAKGSARWREQLAPGEQLLVDAASERREKQLVDAADVSSWARGWLVFRNLPLNEVVREINRYSRKQVLLADTSLGDLKVAGRFIAGDSESIVKAIAEILPVRVVDGGSYEIMLFKRYDN